MTDLGSLTVGGKSQAYGINNNGQIVGDDVTDAWLSKFGLL